MWIYLLISLLTYLLSPRDTKAQQRQALLNGALAGAGSYYIGTQTDWGRDIVADIDGAVFGNSSGKKVNPDGTIVDATGKIINVPGAGDSTNGWDVLKTWGATGTATVIGTTALATSGTLQKYLPWAIFAFAVYALAR